MIRNHAYTTLLAQVLVVPTTTAMHTHDRRRQVQVMYGCPGTSELRTVYTY